MVRAAFVVSAFTLAAADWESFKAKYNKVYNSDDIEAAHRATYELNMQRNADHNALNLGFRLGENQFSDLTQEQFRVAAGLGGYKEPPLDSMTSAVHLGEHVYDGSELAASVDWTTKGAVTAVKQQGSCGSCWAFATTGMIEGAWQIASGSLQTISEQQFLDCSGAGSCSGGVMDWAIDYATDNGMATAASYPYAGRQYSCQISFTTAIHRGHIAGYTNVQHGSKSGLQSALMGRPVGVAIEADQYAFRNYESGVLSSGCGTDIDHAVTFVGYGTASGTDYWLVKNSWGRGWGDNGYIKISSMSNVCGVMTGTPLYARVNAAVEV
jgi:cathepsin L